MRHYLERKLKYGLKEATPSNEKVHQKYDQSFEVGLNNVTLNDMRVPVNDNVEVRNRSPWNFRILHTNNRGHESALPRQFFINEIWDLVTSLRKISQPAVHKTTCLFTPELNKAVMLTCKFLQPLRQSYLKKFDAVFK